MAGAGLLREPVDPPRGRLRTYYDRYAAYLPTGRAHALAEFARAALTPVAGTADVPATIDGDVPDLRFLATTSKGLLLWNGSGYRKLVPGPTFGLTLRGGTAYVFQQTGHFGRVLAVRDWSAGMGVTPVLWGLSRSIHQIDFVDDELFVVDTLRNRVRVYRLPEAGRVLHASEFVRELRVDRKAPPDHYHLNSVYRHGDLLYLMAHNHTVKTGRKSEILVYDAATFAPVRTIPTDGTCCHNVFHDPAGLVFCRSLERTVALGDKDVFRVEGLTRGLAVDANHVLVGVTTIAADPVRRDNDKSSVEVLTRGFTRLGGITTPSCQLRDVRLLTGDLAMSNPPAAQVAPGQPVASTRPAS